MDRIHQMKIMKKTKGKKCKENEETAFDVEILKNIEKYGTWKIVIVMVMVEN